MPRVLLERKRSLSVKVFFDRAQFSHEDVAGLSYTVLICQRARQAATTGGHGRIAQHHAQKLRDSLGMEVSR